jgi:hypothetical protein
MPGMKVTVSAAMRARDVSRPGPEDEAAAERAQDPRPRGGAPRGDGRDSNPPAARGREDSGSREARPSRKGGAGGRSRRKRR